MKSQRSIVQLLLLVFPWFVRINNGRDDNNNRLVQLNDCMCLGYTQTFECTVFGAGATIWRSLAFDCQRRDEIFLRHSEYTKSDREIIECNNGRVVASSIRKSEDCYTSQLNVTITQDIMVNDTETIIECAHDPLKLGEQTTSVGQLIITQEDKPHPPPSVHLEVEHSSYLVFGWDEAITQCFPAQYIITAINCGVCPNTTADKNVTCHIQSDISLHTNNTCLFAVQTEICGYLLGERSEYVIVHINGMSEVLEGEGESTTSMPRAGLELANNAIVIPLVASVMSMGVFLLLLIIVVLIIFMSKQVAKNNAKSKVNTTLQDDAFMNTAASNNQEGIYSLLQPPEDNDVLNSVDQNDIVVYADIGPSPGEGLCFETTLCFQDERVEYAEVKSLNHKPAFNPSQSPDSSIPLDLNNLLHQIGTEIACKWYQLGIAVGISEEMLDECSNHSPEEAVVEILDYWIRNHKPSWHNVAEALNEIGLHELAYSLPDQGRLPMQIDHEDNDGIKDLHTVSTSPAYDDSF